MGDLIMHRASSRFMPRIALACIPLLMLPPAVAGLAHDSAVAAPAATDPTGMTITIKNCNDSGPGSLRAAVAGALSGDTIDMRGLGCRRINVTSGAIVIPQHDLTLVGGGITVDANNTSSIFRHHGTGWLRIRGMTIARGFYQRRANGLGGGCIYSGGNVELWGSLVHWCRARGIPGLGGTLGGGVYANGDVRLIDSQILGNTAAGAGGVYARGRLTAIRSRICGNHAHFMGGAIASGLNINYSTFSKNTGGALSLATLGGDHVLANSTISGNVARTTMSLSVGSGSVMIVNSTISGNTSAMITLFLQGRERSIVNSTIVSNRHTGATLDGCARFATVYLLEYAENPVHIDSTIISNNVCTDKPYYDVGRNSADQYVLLGANNLIMLSNSLPLPPDTISADPRLAPLVNNGGRTETHALLDDSPAIDMGNNAAGLAYDQRGAGFPRVKGAQADIGAYER